MCTIKGIERTVLTVLGVFKKIVLCLTPWTIYLFFYVYTRPEQGVIWFMLLLPGSVEMDKEISESEVFDIRKGEETLAAKPWSHLWRYTKISSPQIED